MEASSRCGCWACCAHQEAIVAVLGEACIHMRANSANSDATALADICRLHDVHSPTFLQAVLFEPGGEV